MLTAEGAGVEAHRIGVVGAGVMGSEIARVAAAAGLDVTLRDVDAAALRRGLDHVAVVEEGPAPMGPFALGDLIGLDTPLHVQRDLEEAYGDRFAAGDELAALVARGHLGAKTGAGFLDGSPPARRRRRRPRRGRAVLPGRGRRGQRAASPRASPPRRTPTSR